MQYFRILALILLTTGAFESSRASPIVLTDDCVNTAATCAIGISELSIGNTLYNVNFSQSSYDDLFSGSLPTFFGDSGGAYNALSAMLTSLSGAGVVGIIGKPAAGGPPSAIVVPKMVAGSGDPFSFLGYFPSGSFFITGGSDVISSSTPLSALNILGGFNAYAVFTPVASSVPLPGVLPLVGLSLFMLYFFRRPLSNLETGLRG